MVCTCEGCLRRIMDAKTLNECIKILENNSLRISNTQKEIYDAFYFIKKILFENGYAIKTGELND